MEEKKRTITTYQLFSVYQQHIKAATWLSQTSIRKCSKEKADYLICLSPKKNLVSEGTRDDYPLPPEMLKHQIFLNTGFLSESNLINSTQILKMMRDKVTRIFLIPRHI